MFQKNRLCFEIMVSIFRLQRLIQQAPAGLKSNMTPAQINTYNAVETEKDNMIAELYTLMQLDRDIQ